MLLVVVGSTVWVLTGLALRPVEKMSAEADRISAMALDRRLPIPEATDELHHLATTLNEMLARLERSSLRQRRFVSDASHELKSPLATIRTIVEVAARDGSIPTEAAEDIGSEVMRMQALVADLLFLARHDEAPSLATAEDVDLDQLALSAAGANHQSRADVRVDTSGVTAARVTGDADRLTQLLRNLVENAVRHADSTVWVEVGQTQGRAVLTVSDDGPGVPASEAERIFERFVRLDASRARDTGGAGLGLAVVRVIARDHGGDIVLGDSHHGGASFEVWLPTD